MRFDPDGTTTGGGCVVAIPPDAVVSDGEFPLSGDGHVVWVCKNDTVSIDGSGNVLFVESNGSALVSGTGNTVYALSGADMAVYTQSNTFYFDGDFDLLDEAGTNTRIDFSPLTFDTQNASPDGCYSTSV